MNAHDFFDLALWVTGAGHFLVLVASFQVPRRLRWNADLAQLTTFNRKLFWTYGGFTVLTITAFGTLMLALHQELLRGDRSALAVAVFIASYWTARILVDVLYFSHKDWPQGRLMVVGHFLLTSLFVFLAGVNWAVVWWHWR